MEVVQREWRTGRAQGLLLDDMMPVPGEPVSQGPGAATWLGTCRTASSPYVRRLDIKLFPRRCATCKPCTLPVPGASLQRHENRGVQCE